MMIDEYVVGRRHNRSSRRSLQSTDVAATIHTGSDHCTNSRAD